MSNPSEKFFYQYVRDSNRNPIGVVIGFPESKRIGWSKVKVVGGQRLDHFNREKGLMIATKRAAGYNAVPPQDVEYVIQIIADRITRYRTNRGL